MTLVAAGFSICGVAATPPSKTPVRARERDVALAVALVTVFGSLKILIVPVLAGGLGLTTIKVPPG